MWPDVCLVCLVQPAIHTFTHGSFSQLLPCIIYIIALHIFPCVYGSDNIQQKYVRKTTGANIQVSNLFARNK